MKSRFYLNLLLTTLSSILIVTAGCTKKAHPPTANFVSIHPPLLERLGIISSDAPSAPMRAASVDMNLDPVPSAENPGTPEEDLARFNSVPVTIHGDVFPGGSCTDWTAPQCPADKPYPDPVLHQSRSVQHATVLKDQCPAVSFPADGADCSGLTGYESCMPDLAGTISTAQAEVSAEKQTAQTDCEGRGGTFLVSPACTAKYPNCYGDMLAVLIRHSQYGVCCTSLSPIAEKVKWAYAVDSLHSLVFQFQVGPQTGTLSALQPLTVSAGPYPMSIAISAEGLFAYIVSDRGVSQHQIDQKTGALNPLPLATVATGVGPRSIVITPDGRWAYVTNLISGSVSQYKIDKTTGILIPLSVAQVATGKQPVPAVIAPSGQWLYVANQGSNTVSQYKIDQTTGMLSVLGSVATGSRPGAIVISPDGQWVYVSNFLGGSVSQFKIDPTNGALNPMVPSTVRTPGPFSLAVSPHGRWVYVVNTDDNKVSQFQIDPSNGTLTPSDPSSVTSAVHPMGIAISSNGQWAYVTSSEKGVSQYRIDQANGALKPMNPADVSAGSSHIHTIVVR